MTVKQFGAVGDAETDDTLAIQAALDFAFENKEGNPVVFPSGGYVISRPLIVHRNVDIVGAGLGFASSIIPIGCDAIWINGETQGGSYAFRNTIKSLNINMMRASAGTAIVVDRAYNIKLSEIFVYDAPEIGISVTNSNHICLEGVIVYGASDQRGTGVKIKNSTVNVYNIDIENTLIALEIDIDGQSAAHVSVFGGFIERFGKHAINIIGDSNNVFIGLNIQADSEEKNPVNIISSEKNNTFIGGHIGYAEALNKPYDTSSISYSINVG